MSLHAEAIVTVSLLVLATIAPDRELQVAAFCGLGAAVGGYVGAALFPAKTSQKLARRWLVNFSLALFIAPAVTAWLEPQYPGVPIYYLAVLTGGLIGITGVTLLTMALPALYARVKSILNATPNPNDRSPSE